MEDIQSTPDTRFDIHCISDSVFSVTQMDTRRRRDSRSRSPVNDHSRHARHSSQAHRKDVRYRARASADSLPYGARQLTKHDLDFHRPMFALYLDIQKRRDIEELPDDEVKGRWKSFLNKW